MEIWSGNMLKRWMTASSAVDRRPGFFVTNVDQLLSDVVAHDEAGAGCFSCPKWATATWVHIAQRVWGFEFQAWWRHQSAHFPALLLSPRACGRRHYGFSESEGDTRANCERQTASWQRAEMSCPNAPKTDPLAIKALVVLVTEVDVVAVV
jgi:hypothetical protein